MKPLWFCSLVFLTALISAGCDAAEPEGDDEVIRRVVLVLDGSDGSTRSVQVRLAAVAVEAADTLVLDPAVAYTGAIQLFTEAGSDLAQRIRREAEAYQLFYTVEGLPGVDLRVSDRETDYGPNELAADYQVGLAYTVAVHYRPGDPTVGRLRIQLGHFVEEPKSARGLTVSPTLDVALPVVVDVATGPGARETITGLRMTVGGFSFQVSTDGGLVGVVLPVTLTLAPGTVAGSIELTNDRGEAVTPKIRRAGAFYQVFYTPRPPLEDVLQVVATDEDFGGLPIGLTFTMTVPEGGALPESGSLRIRLARYDPAAGQVKDGQTPGDDLLVDAVLPVRISPSRALP